MMLESKHRKEESQQLTFSLHIPRDQVNQVGPRPDGDRYVHGNISMAHTKRIEIPRKDGSTTIRWQAVALDQFGRQRTQNHDTKKEAEEDAWERQRLMRQEWSDPAGGKMALAAFVEEIWLPTRIWKPATVATVESILDNHILPTFGYRPLAAIKPSHVQAWVKNLNEGLAPSTVCGIFRHFKAILGMASDEGFLPTRPCKGVKLPAVYTKPIKPMSEAQAIALIEHTEPRYRALTAVQLFAGLRVSEAIGLTVDRVDLDRGLIIVDRQLIHTNGGEWQFVDPKTTASVREVPIGAYLIDELQFHLSVFESHTGLMFESPKRQPIRRNRVSDTILRRAYEAAGIPKVGAHGLRHFFVSLLINEGLSVKAVQVTVGHASARETFDTYGHLWHNDDDKIRDAIDSRFCPSPDRQPTDTNEAESVELPAQSGSEAA